MLNLWLKELKLIAENRGIKGYESTSIDRLSSALIASVKKMKRILMTQNQQEIKITMQIK